MNQLNALTDQQLIAIWHSENELVFAEIYNRYWDKLLAVAYHRLDDLQDAEECVQDVFCKFWALRKVFELKEKDLSYYLSHAIRNQVFTVLKRRYRAREKNKQLVIEDDINLFTPEKKLILAELTLQFDKAIDALPPQCKLVYNLKRTEGLTVNQIAEKLDISTNTVKSHLKKANNDIRNNTEILTLLVILYTVLQHK